MAVVKRGNTWQVQVRVGKDAAGKWIRRGMTCDTKAEAERAERKLMAEAEGNRARFVAPTKDTLGAFLTGWFARRKPRLRPTTQAAYDAILRVHVLPALGAVRLSDLSPRRVQAWLDSMGASQRTDDCRTVLTTALNDAVKLGLVAVNAAARTEAPHRVKPKRQSFTLEEVGALAAAAQGLRVGNLVTVAAYTGLRRGELLGLKWEDVDFGAATVTVRRQVVQVKGGPFVQEATKTEAGARVVPLFLPALAALKAQKALLAKEGLVCPWVFPAETGRPWAPGRVSGYFAIVVEKANLPANKPLHALRHTAASVLLSAGVEPEQAAKIMGHASLAVFYSIYADLLPQAGQNVRHQVDAFLAGAKPKKRRAR